MAAGWTCGSRGDRGALMAFLYLFTNNWALWGVGVALMVLL
jgi:hypothetical protein